MVQVWIPENDLDYYYANGFPSKYWTSPKAKCISMQITVTELQKWQHAVPKNLPEYNHNSKQILKD